MPAKKKGSGDDSSPELSKEQQAEQSHGMYAEEGGQQPLDENGQPQN